MSTQSKDEEYYQRQSNIYSLLFQAYLDKYLLESVDYFKANLPKETNSEINNTVFVVAHFCDLAKRDLALTLWKVFYDNSKDANTVKNLNRYLFEQHRFKYKVVETENIKKIRPLIIAARNGFIAHNLMDDTGRILQISDMLDALEDVRSIFNVLSLKTFDSRVKPLTDSQTYSISFYEKMGFNPLLMSVLRDTTNAIEEGDESNV